MLTYQNVNSPEGRLSKDELYTLQVWLPRRLTLHPERLSAWSFDFTQRWIPKIVSRKMLTPQKFYSTKYWLYAIQNADSQKGWLHKKLTPKRVLPQKVDFTKCRQNKRLTPQNVDSTKGWLHKMLTPQKVDSTKCRLHKRLTPQNVDSTKDWLHKIPTP